MSMKLMESDVASSPLAVLPDTAIVRKIRDGETALFEVLMRRHNQRVYRAVRAVMNAEADVEDVMQQAYVNAFTHLSQFEGRAQFSTWLIRIALNEAFAKRRKIKGPESVVRIQFELDDDRRGGTWTHSSHRKRIRSVRRTPRNSDAYSKPRWNRCRTTTAPCSCSETSRD
jgi:DNA-directed RNA polymerase specialized sigma24 family protein